MVMPRASLTKPGWLRAPSRGEALLLLGAMLLLAWVWLGFASFRERLEMNAVQVTIRNIGNGLRLTVAQAMMQQRMGDLAGLPGSNPVALLAGPPARYLGEHRGALEAHAGSWYFDSERRELVYTPQFDRHLRRAAGGGAALRWTLSASQARRSNADDSGTEGLVLVSVTPYEWF